MYTSMQAASLRHPVNVVSRASQVKKRSDLYRNYKGADDSKHVVHSESMPCQPDAEHDLERYGIALNL